MPDQAAQQVLLENWDGTFPVDPRAVAEKAGISIRPVSSRDYSGRAYIENGVQVIEFNTSDSSLRQRFTIAHELGHHALHHTEAGHRFRDDPSKFSLNVVSPKETAANKFAAELLMPELAVKHFVINKNITSLEELAKLFSVSTVAMKFRLKNLGLL